MAVRRVRVLNPGWVSVCSYDALAADIGVAALVKGRQVALFKLADGSLRAVGNRDPISGMQKIARGVVGQAADGRRYVALPAAKVKFDLETGESLADGSVSLPVYPVRVTEGMVEVCVPVRRRRRQSQR